MSLLALEGEGDLFLSPQTEVFKQLSIAEICLFVHIHSLTHKHTHTQIFRERTNHSCVMRAAERLRKNKR